MRLSRLAIFAFGGFWGTTEEAAERSEAVVAVEEEVLGGPGAGAGPEAGAGAEVAGGAGWRESSKARVSWGSPCCECEVEEETEDGDGDESGVNEFMRRAGADKGIYISCRCCC